MAATFLFWFTLSAQWSKPELKESKYLICGRQAALKWIIMFVHFTTSWDDNLPVLCLQCVEAKQRIFPSFPITTTKMHRVPFFRKWCFCKTSVTKYFSWIGFNENQKKTKQKAWVDFTSCWLWHQISRVWFEFLSRFCCLVRTLVARLQRLYAYSPSTYFSCVSWIRSEMFSVTKVAVGVDVFADSLHRTERIEWLCLEFFADWGNNLADCQKVYSLSQGFARLFGLTVLSSRMISYLLLLNEHKETLDFGLGCPWHSYSIWLPPHTPWFSSHTLYFILFYLFQRPTALLTLHLVFTYTRKKNNILNMMPAEPGALIKYMRTQICTFFQSGGGYPAETMGWVSQNLNLK